ncbi:hypothetical protein EX30DRAFT_199333 [Ascodesmis nigricans]|uniref:Uncharacterized protein n=1 Tax=Ascodesmis nigricans TaxID=341454 RepID=A0A4S2MRI2_9PEZI|nr:hypothetical protein EX30DRAFT_199333 [Ascodesmis nigricans]
MGSSRGCSVTSYNRINRPYIRSVTNSRMCGVVPLLLLFFARHTNHGARLSNLQPSALNPKPYKTAFLTHPTSTSPFQHRHMTSRR